MENLRQTTELVRKSLLYMANQNNPFEFEFKQNVAKAIEKDEYFTNGLIEYMCRCHLLSGTSTTFNITPNGMQLAQDIANDGIWNEAMKICDENKVYSMNAVMYAVNSIIRKRIDKALEN